MFKEMTVFRTSIRPEARLGKWENFFISSNQKKWKFGTYIYISKKKLEFNVSRNNTTLAEFLVFEIWGYLLRFKQQLFSCAIRIKLSYYS